MKGVKECIVCNKEKCSYKCPKCMSPYCSLGCWATHKGTCAAGSTEVGGGTQPTIAASEKVVVQGASEHDVLILQPAEKEGMRKSKELVSLLKSKRLRDDITCVDSCSDRPAALKAMRLKNPEFNQFVELMLSAVKTSTV
jgi:hypothetical protein